VYTLLIISIIFLATLENLWPSIAGFLTTPQGFVFLGTVHHPGDYFYYLSQFAQGSTRWLTTVDLYTAEPIHSSFVGWSNVLLGRMFHLIGVSPIPAYQISIGVFTVGVLIAALLLCRVVFPKPFAALTAFFFFCLFHAFPITRDGISSYGDYWNNYAVPRVRLGGVPHQLITAMVSMLVIYLVIRIIQKRPPSRSMIIMLALSSFILAGLQPVLWVLVAGSIGAALVAQHAPDGKKMIHLMKNAAPVILTLILSGMAPLFYLARLFQTVPFSQLKAWEALQQTPLTPQHFLTATGPILLIALFSVPIALSRRSFAHYFMIIFTTSSLVLFLSPIPAYIGISHVRFMSTLTILCLSITAALGVSSLLTASSRWAKALAILLLVILTYAMLPNHLKTLRLVSTFTPTNTFQYISKQDYDLLRHAGAISNPGDIFLVTTPYTTLFPAISGRKVYDGHPLLTVDASSKQALSQAFFSHAMAPTTRYDFVRENNISWIIAAKTQKESVSARWVKLISESDTLLLYQVQ